jgi:hypothetical protein
LILVNTKLLDSIPFLRIGEKINYFNLLDMSGKKVNSDALNEKGKKWFSSLPDRVAFATGTLFFGIKYLK